MQNLRGFVWKDEWWSDMEGGLRSEGWVEFGEGHDFLEVCGGGRSRYGGAGADHCTHSKSVPRGSSEKIDEPLGTRGFSLLTDFQTAQEARCLSLPTNRT